MDTDSLINHVKTDDIPKTLQKMLKQGLRLQILKQADYCLKEKVNK